MNLKTIIMVGTLSILPTVAFAEDVKKDTDVKKENPTAAQPASPTTRPGMPMSKPAAPAKESDKAKQNQTAPINAPEGTPKDKKSWW